MQAAAKPSGAFVNVAQPPTRAECWDASEHPHVQKCMGRSIATILGAGIEVSRVDAESGERFNDHELTQAMVVWRKALRALTTRLLVVGDAQVCIAPHNELSKEELAQLYHTREVNARKEVGRANANLESNSSQFETIELPSDSEDGTRTHAIPLKQLVREGRVHHLEGCPVVQLAMCNLVVLGEEGFSASSRENRRTFEISCLQNARHRRSVVAKTIDPLRHYEQLRIAVKNSAEYAARPFVTNSRSAQTDAFSAAAAARHGTSGLSKEAIDQQIADEETLERALYASELRASDGYEETSSWFPTQTNKGFAQTLKNVMATVPPGRVWNVHSFPTRVDPLTAMHLNLNDVYAAFGLTLDMFEARNTTLQTNAMLLRAQANHKMHLSNVSDTVIGFLDSLTSLYYECTCCDAAPSITVSNDATWDVDDCWRAYDEGLVDAEVILTMLRDLQGVPLTSSGTRKPRTCPAVELRRVRVEQIQQQMRSPQQAAPATEDAVLEEEEAERSERAKRRNRRADASSDESDVDIKDEKEKKKKRKKQTDQTETDDELGASAE